MILLFSNTGHHTSGPVSTSSSVSVSYFFFCNVVPYSACSPKRGKIILLHVGDFLIQVADVPPELVAFDKLIYVEAQRKEEQFKRT